MFSHFTSEDISGKADTKKSMSIEKLTSKMTEK